jgi:hypothetical protein
MMCTPWLENEPGTGARAYFFDTASDNQSNRRPSKSALCDEGIETDAEPFDQYSFRGN